MVVNTHTHTLYFISYTSFCHLRPQIAKARRGGQRMIRCQWRKGFCYLFFIVLWSCGMKICLHVLWNFIYGTNVSVLQSWIPPQVVDHKQGAFWFTNKRVQVKILSILKPVSFEILAGNDKFSEHGMQAEAHCKRNLNPQLWSIRRKISHRFSRNFCRHYYKS